MRLVNHQTFLALPTNTLFSTYEPHVFGPLMIKGDTLYGDGGRAIDFCEQGIADSIDCTGSNDFDDQLTHALATGASLAMDFDSQGRDGTFEQDQFYAVWEAADVAALIRRLAQCLPPLSTTTRQLRPMIPTNPTLLLALLALALAHLTATSTPAAKGHAHKHGKPPIVQTEGGEGGDTEPPPDVDEP